MKKENQEIIDALEKLISDIENWKWQIISLNPELQNYINTEMLPMLYKRRNELKKASSKGLE